ncbi:HAD family hydrolase [Paraburkholderia sp. EG287A]|uniref:HAD family hydrolase n=1 Tax=unclassified Paraburkholderia TaxID=2615204 RepID=UPI0034D1FBA4
MKSTLVLDWNGTLLDDTELILQTINSIIFRFNKPSLDLAIFQEKCEFPFSVLYRNLGLTENEIAIAQNDGNALFHDYYESRVGSVLPRDGVSEMLKLAKKNSMRVIVLSNHICGPIKIALRRLGIQNYITDVLAYDNRATQYEDVTKGEKLAIYIKKMGIDPSLTFIVGDTPEECSISRTLHLKSVAITGGAVSDARLRDAQPDYLIRSHFELEGIFEKNGIL